MTTKRLRIGSKAPGFWTRDIDGNEVDTSKLSGDTLLVFLRYAGCPFCNLAVHTLSEQHDRLISYGCSVLAFVQSPEDSVERGVIGRQQTEPQFPIIADHEQDFYKLYGVETNALRAAKHATANAKHWLHAVKDLGYAQGRIDGDASLSPAAFIVGTDGIIKYADYDAGLYTEAQFAPIYKALGR